MVLLFRTPQCKDPLEYYLPEVQENEEGEESRQEVTAPDVEYLDTEDVFAVADSLADVQTTPTTRRKKVHM